ncbi:helix-turn-helix domain-containing protein [Streptomyces sp. CH6]|uniref:helix-turn-helix domain-containing protein n=1 Tax=Streptomyces sp. CH6 TaxID=3420320 RepID=UPI003D0071EE
MASGSENEAFAARLKELKERSGLSYGQLAKRLHLSTSTLHRYCNGDALPAEFTPADRLARLCGADRAELMDLHRRWLLADAARAAAKDQQETARGERGPSARTEPEPEKAAETPVAAETPAPEKAAQSPAPEKAPETPGRAETPGGGGVTPGSLREEAAEAPAPEAPAPPEPRPAPPAAGEGTAGATVTGTAPPSRSRRPRLLLASAAALVVLVAGGGIAAGRLAGGDAGEGDAAAKGGPAAAGHPVTPSAAGTGSAAASESPSPSPSSPPSPRTTPDRTASSAPGTSAPAPLATGTPVTARVNAHAWEDPCSPRYLVHSGPEEVPPPPTEGDAAGWARALGAVPAGEQRIAVTLQGRGAETVVLNAMRVRALRSGPPLAWDAYIMGVGCGGNVPAEGFTTDLDAPRPELKPLSGQRDFPYKVSASDPEVFYVTARTSAHDVTWCLEIDWSSGDRHGTLRVTDAGTPFRTAPAKGRPTWRQPPGDTAWGPEVKG